MGRGRTGRGCRTGPHGAWSPDAAWSPDGAAVMPRRGRYQGLRRSVRRVATTVATGTTISS